jgi:polysaccharide biosynthesis protein PslH
MKILIVAPYPPSRIRIRLHGFVNHLAKQHDVTVLALCSSKREIQDAQASQNQGFTLLTVHDKRLLKMLRTIFALFMHLPLQVAFDASPRLRAVLAQQLAEGHFDLVHVEFIRALGVLPAEVAVPVVWDAVDCISDLYEQGGRSGATVLLRWLGLFEARRVRVYERIQVARFQQVLVTSARDREALLSVASASCDPTERLQIANKITVLPHGIDQEYFQPAHLTRLTDTLIFAGKMSFHANIAAVLLLTKQIMPLIWQKRPGTRLVIAGSNPPSSVCLLARDTRIEVTGYVTDLRPYIEQATIAVCPLPYAVGLQNKILEAMALGTPVVASPQAAAGLQACTGSDLLVGADPQEFASAVLRIMNDPQLHLDLSTRGRAYVATHHDWAQIMQHLTGIYEEALHMHALSKRVLLPVGN